jgi:hypothetical protein
VRPMSRKISEANCAREFCEMNSGIPVNTGRDQCRVKLAKRKKIKLF